MRLPAWLKAGAQAMSSTHLQAEAGRVDSAAEAVATSPGLTEGGSTQRQWTTERVGSDEEPAVACQIRASSLARA